MFWYQWCWLKLIFSPDLHPSVISFQTPPLLVSLHLSFISDRICEYISHFPSHIFPFQPYFPQFILTALPTTTLYPHPPLQLLPFSLYPPSHPQYSPLLPSYLPLLITVSPSFPPPSPYPISVPHPPFFPSMSSPFFPFNPLYPFPVSPTHPSHLAHSPPLSPTSSVHLPPNPRHPWSQLPPNIRYTPSLSF